MSSSSKILSRSYLEVAFFSIFFLFFFQLFSDFTESTYILVLMTLSLNQNALALIFLLSPLILVFFRDKIPDSFILVVGELMIVCRVIEPMFDTVLRMIISGIGVGCFMILLPVILVSKNSGDVERRSLSIGLGLAVAIASSVLLRTLNSTIDISTYGGFQVIGWILAVIETLMLVGFWKTRQGTSPEEQAPAPEEPTPTTRPKGLRRITLGLTSILFFICFAFISPVVISRWTEGDYLLITSLVAGMLALLVVILSLKPELITRMTPRLLWVWNILFISAFVMTILVNQILFLGSPQSYPIASPPTTFLHQIPLVLMLVTFPIILIDFMLLSREIMSFKPRPSVSKIGVSFTLAGGLYMVLMILSLVFTSTWGFIPVVGPLFRDLFWLVFLIVGVVILLSLKRVSESSRSFQRRMSLSKTEIISSALVVVILIGTLVSAIAIEAQPITPSGDPTSVRILTYNIAQGMNDQDIKNYDGQLELIRSIDADIIGLQETSKIAGGSDVVRYFANGLDQYSYFGPKGVTGTTGVALLSKYPIVNPRTIYHYTEDVDRKQTVTIEAEITVGSRTFTIYVTHTYGRTSTKSELQTDILNEASGKTDVVFMGDFNFGPFSEPYNLTTDVLDDSWWVRWPTGSDTLGYNNSRNIDHIFVSSGTTISECQYVQNSQSDHPAYWADIQW